MSDDRARMLGTIRTSLGRDALAADAAQACDDRLARPRQNVMPTRGRTGPETRLSTFVTEAERVNATTDRVESWNSVPAAISGYLAGANLPAVVRTAPDPVLAAIPWHTSPTLTVTSGTAGAGDLVSVTGASGSRILGNVTPGSSVNWARCLKWMAAQTAPLAASSAA